VQLDDEVVERLGPPAGRVGIVVQPERSVAPESGISLSTSCVLYKYVFVLSPWAKAIGLMRTRLRECGCRAARRSVARTG
jgi:hypothetical protein